MVEIVKAQYKGFTLVEILVATILLALTVGGIANVFVASKRYIMHARLRMSGGEMGKYFLDPLQMNVRQDQWDTAEANAAANCLKSNPSAGCPAAQAGYTPGYTVTDVAGTGGLRRVQLQVNWTEN